MEPKAKLPYRIAIVGGGIGGLCAALQLHYHCKNDSITIDVYEQAAQYCEIGAGVGIGVNAAKLLHRIGIGDELNAIAGCRQGMWISFRRFDNGDEIVTVPADDTKSIRQAPVHRAEFLDLLLKTVRERRAARLHTKKVCSKVNEQGAAVSVVFEDGTSAEADMVVACDGIHSNVRKQFISDSPTYSGRIAYRGLVDIGAIESWWPFESYSISWLAPGKHFFVFPVSQNRTLNIVAFVSKPEDELGDLKESWTSRGDWKQCAKDFEDFDGVVRKVIELMPEHPSKWLLDDRKPLSQWMFANEKVVLVGDAAHAMLPDQGKGLFLSSFTVGDEDSICLKKEVQYVLDTANWNYQSGAHERQWGTTTINPILNAVARLHGGGVKLLNLYALPLKSCRHDEVSRYADMQTRESCSIQPIELRPERGEGDKIDLDAESTHSNDTAKTHQPPTASRMVDYGFGLGLSITNRRIIDDAFSCLEDSMRSLNQSLAYQDDVPLFADIEIKRCNSQRPPEVQLGIWQAAGYLKRKLHGWSTCAMPMPGICVNGHDWVAYINFESAENNMIAIGPIEMGSTSSIPGIWQILYKLDQLLSWGESEYKAWFETEVMAWAEKLAADR
ncbi:MAG: hypothetical protein OHK93_004678 [Ramalina farinacea]|uniref:FAD-binding domain-containing protein n=1 Tax=Ramalina farinacea TaxID=258253 RepID=A0AA43QUM8_9LECA|nr:hypothetical protein [Ramalina farinacea]